MQPEAEKSAWIRRIRRKEAKKVLRMGAGRSLDEPKWPWQETAKDTGESWKMQLDGAFR